MRRSSPGNPYHVPAGSPKGGQFTSKNKGVPVYYSDEYYAQRTNERFGRDFWGFPVTEVNGNQHSNLKGTATSKYIRCGGFDKSKVKPVVNSPVSGSKLASKPFGGVWMSREDAEMGWTQWCKRNDEERWSQNPVKLEIHNAKILHLYDKEDLEKLPKTGEKLTDIDYAKLSRFYDGIEVHIDNLYSTMFGWDCDSTVIFNKDVISERSNA